MTLKMEAAGSSKIFVPTRQTTRRPNPADRNVNLFNSFNCTCNDFMKLLSNQAVFEVTSSLSMDGAVFWDRTPVCTASHLRERVLLRRKTSSTNIWIKVTKKR
jgi:hypothetical protein